MTPTLSIWMVSIQDVADEIAENWPAFVYILLMIGFSVCFFRERRQEVRRQLQMTDRLLDRICGRLDRLEKLLQQSRAYSASPGESEPPANGAAVPFGAVSHSELRNGSGVRTTKVTVV